MNQEKFDAEKLRDGMADVGEIVGLRAFFLFREAAKVAKRIGFCKDVEQNLADAEKIRQEMVANGQVDPQHLLS